MAILLLALFLGLMIGIFLLSTSTIEYNEDVLDDELTDEEIVKTDGSVKVISLNSRFDHVEKVKEIELPKEIISNDSFVAKELTPHVAEIVNKDSKKYLQKRVRKLNTKSKVL